MCLLGACKTPLQARHIHKNIHSQSFVSFSIWQVWLCKKISQDNVWLSVVCQLMLEMLEQSFPFFVWRHISECRCVCSASYFLYVHYSAGMTYFVTRLHVFYHLTYYLKVMQAVLDASVVAIFPEAGQWMKIQGLVPVPRTHNFGNLASTFLPRSSHWSPAFEFTWEWLLHISTRHIHKALHHAMHHRNSVLITFGMATSCFWFITCSPDISRLLQQTSQAAKEQWPRLPPIIL